VVWVLPFRTVFRGIAHPDPDAPPEKGQAEGRTPPPDGGPGGSPGP
jgi:hypothetical protein